ncbi:spatacsin isoform X2 [Diachasma alloeum]|uniref:spatacsin isoform X2 n=1 Tax=Diachasma alloeum TaxID=454923 RepID=UPI000738130F|nr:spatacsin isoform X2 [Diachasma alloeum]
MEVVGGIPVECLTPGELAGVWSGWTSMGDREMVREASAKGNHINLAFKFLAYRRHWTVAEAQKYFYSEVEVWIGELLGKKQIHRASHILQKVGKDPIVYIAEICTKSRDPELRDYLANHVLKNKGFSEEQIDAWEIIKCIKKYETIQLSRDTLDGHSIEKISIEEMLNLPPHIKTPLLTELYFHTYESCLSKKLKSSAVWDYLLTEDNIELLIKWIDRKFGEENSKNREELQEEQKSHLVDVFDRLEISPEMIERIEQSNMSFPFREILLNHLCKYGIFINKERSDVKLTLARFFSAEITPKNFDGILSKSSCNLDKEEFSRKRHSILFYQNEENSDERLYCQDQELLRSLRKLNDSENSVRGLITGICQTIHKISDNPQEYLKNESLLTFYLIFLAYLESKARRDNKDEESPTFEEFLTTKTNLTVEDIEIPSGMIAELLQKIPYLKNCLENKEKENDITMYQLLDGLRNLNIHELFRWRFEKEQMPNFANASLIKKYGHKEKLNYKYYLKEARPSMAAYVLLNPEGKQADLSSKMKSKISFQAHAFALKNLDNPEIISNCICFIEFLGVDSECLRLHATAADYVHSKLNISINDLLESVAYQNTKDLEILLNHLEQSFAVEFTSVSMSNVSDFVQSLKSWEFVVRFARAHNALFPVSFLKYLARGNHWFEFVLVGNIFRYPLEQVLENAAYFEDPTIREHLLISLSNSHLNPPQTQRPKSSRQYQRKHSHSLPSHSPTISTQTSPESPLKTDQCFPFNQKTPFDQDLWLTILKCDQSQDPPGALLKAARETSSSVLIILAACYEPSSTASYCYSWLVISIENEDLIRAYSDCLADQIWPIRRISELFRKLVSLGYIDTLSKGFEIFLPENPLHLFFKFLLQCTKSCEFEESQKILVDFINTCSTFKSNKTIDWNDSDTTYLNNEYWIATVCIECIASSLNSNFLSTHLQQKFLNLIVDCNFNEEVHIDEPDFQSLLDIITILSRTPVKMDFEQIKLTGEEFTVTQEVERCIRNLVEIEDFPSALELSKIAHLPCSNIILEQYRTEFKKHLLNAPSKSDAVFWKKCAYDIRKYEVRFEDAASFFIEHAGKVESYKEMYEILELALKTLKPISTDQQTIDTVEMAMWKACILAGPAAIEILREKKHFNKLKTELLSGISNLRVSCSLNDESEEQAIQALINRFLDVDDLETSLRISAIFNYKHKDLQILMLSLSLAEGELSPYQLSPQHQILLESSDVKKINQISTLTNRGPQRRLSSSSLNLPSPISSADGNDSTSMYHQQVDSLLLLEKLVKNLDHGRDVGRKILVLYRLSIHLKGSYRTLLMSRDPMELLFEITNVNHSDKFALMREVISAYRIQNSAVTKFWAGELLLHLTRQVEENLDESMLMWGYPLDVTFTLSTILCDDASLLGWELLKGVTMRLGQSLGARRDASILKIVVELLIKAHHCFTVACSMEGIASVLRKSQQLSNTLQSLKLWSLLVRLVTGVGRFTEMNYILQILKENDQFEFLLGIGTDKVSGLKMALLEFCKKQYPEDKELFTLVAHHFRLYNEIAVMWESEAKGIIRELIRDTRRENIRTLMMNQSVKFTRNDGTERKLQCAMTNYTHATEYYLRDNKLNLANRCCHQAQLVALQVSLLSGVAQGQQATCLLNLTTDEINRVICQALSFPQALILAQSYGYNADWSSAIYQHVIVHGEGKYLKDFLGSKRLTSAIAQDCVCRTEKVITKQMTLNMQSLITELNDIEAKYVLASQLGFKEIVEGLLANDTTGSYLKDTVWKQGFNPQEFIGESFRG